MTVRIAWSSARGVAAGDPVLAFDAAAAGEAASAGALVDLVDDELTWSERVAIDEQAAALARTVADNPAIDAAVREYATYDLRSEFVNVLRGWVAAGAWANQRPQARGASPVADPTCPSSVWLGVTAALAGRVDAPARWVPLSAPPPAPRARLAAARGLVAARQAALRSATTRIVAVPGMNVAVVLRRSDPRALREAGVALALMPTLDHGAAARLALALRLPVAGSAWPARSRHREAAVRRQAREGLGMLHDDAALDAALRMQAQETLAMCELPVRRVHGTLGKWEKLTHLGAILLPTVATGAGKLALRWAHDRGVAVGVVQHGIYVFRGVEGGDRAADTIFTWGPAVAEQVTEWEGAQAQAVVVGTPGISGLRPCAPDDTPIRRVLIASTNNPTGSALGLSAFQDAFMADVAEGLRLLGDAAVELHLRLHPAESPDRYREAIARLGLPIAIREPEPLDAALERSDILISSISSVAFEAAAHGLHVLLWTGRVPADVRRDQFLAPLAEGWPGMFGDAASFRALAGRLVSDPAGCLRSVAPLRDELRRYVAPFDGPRFTAGLAGLAVRRAVIR